MLGKLDSGIESKLTKSNSGSFGHVVLCAHGFIPIVLHIMKPIKGQEDFIVM